MFDGHISIEKRYIHIDCAHDDDDCSVVYGGATYINSQYV